MDKIENLTFTSADGRFGVFLESNQVQEILSLCKKSLPNEIGGILVGRYNNIHNLAVITKIITAPLDSKAGRTWFQRGIKGLKSILNRLWNNNIYYLGEWHFHPFASSSPSDVDLKQIKAISKDKQYNCPEPILLIIGGNPADNFSINMSLTSSKDGLVRLRLVNKT